VYGCELPLNHTGSKGIASIPPGGRLPCRDRQEVATHVEPHHTADELAARIRVEPRAKVGRRLADAAGRGRKPPLDEAARTRLADRLRAGPTAADGVRTLRGEDVRRIL
jgi:hypothetical protein